MCRRPPGIKTGTCGTEWLKSLIFREVQTSCISCFYVFFPCYFPQKAIFSWRAGVKKITHSIQRVWALQRRQSPTSISTHTGPFMSLMCAAKNVPGLRELTRYPPVPATLLYCNYDKSPIWNTCLFMQLMNELALISSWNRVFLACCKSHCRHEKADNVPNPTWQAGNRLSFILSVPKKSLCCKYNSLQLLYIWFFINTTLHL